MNFQDLYQILQNKIPFTDITYGNIISTIIVIFVGYFVALLLSRYIKKSMLKAKMAEILAEFTSRVVRILLIIFVIAVAIGFLGIDVGAAVISISVVSGFILGFAFQETLGNLAAGFMIAIIRPFKKDDYVEVAGIEGKIKSVGTSITTIITRDNKKVIIPNSKVWGEPVINYTALDLRMVDLTVGIHYDDSMPKAIEITMDVLKKNKMVLDDPSPVVAIKELGDSSVNLLVRPWVKTTDYLKAKWELTQQIKEAYDKNKITIPFPQRDIHLYKE
jgi:small-conductance mechanosensitive channel